MFTWNKMSLMKIQVIKILVLALLLTTHPCGLRAAIEHFWAFVSCEISEFVLFISKVLTSYNQHFLF